MAGLIEKTPELAEAPAQFAARIVGHVPQKLAQNIAQAKYLCDLIMREPHLELVAPTSINIVCFRFRPKDMAEEAVKPVNTEIMLRLQEQGIAAISDTTIHGEYCLRVAINNHRTKRCDLDLLIAEILRLGAQMHLSTVIPAKAGTP
jgi:glutamate/tyrosine decarboxylase-like PLP-dependent enzyme